MTIIAEETNTYFNQCIADGFVYECACGEMFRTIDHAATCRKCRNYTWAGYCTHVTDVRTGEVVYGRRPTEEEDRAAAAAYNARVAEERAELDAEEARWRAEAQEEAEWAAEAPLWDIQDRLNK
jgi:regulator of protease activity HflC (stomatin/prohibitin superfamily)